MLLGKKKSTILNLYDGLSIMKAVNLSDSETKVTGLPVTTPKYLTTAAALILLLSCPTVMKS